MSASTDRLKQAIAAGEVGAGRTYESVDQAHRACCAPEAAADAPAHHAPVCTDAMPKAPNPRPFGSLRGPKG